MKVLTYEGVVENGVVHLPAEAKVPEHTKVFVVVPELEVIEVEIPLAPCIRSPRLANPEQVRDFIKEVFDLEVRDADLWLDAFQSSGAGGNSRDSCSRWSEKRWRRRNANRLRG